MKNALPWVLLLATLPCCSGEVKLGPDGKDGAPGGSAQQVPPPDSPYAAIDPASAGCGETPATGEPPPPPLCDPTPAAGAPCDDTLSDPHHCGACGHDCLGGPCENGTCGACELATVTGVNVGFFALDADNVYFTGKGVNRVPRRGGPVTTLSTQQLIVVAVYMANVYGFDTDPNGWADTLFRIPTTGGAPTPVTPLGKGGFTWLAEDGLLFGGYSPEGKPNGELQVVNLADGHKTSLAAFMYAANLGGVDPLRVWGTDATEPTTFWVVDRASGAMHRPPTPPRGIVGDIKYLDGQIYFAQVETYTDYPSEYAPDASVTPGGIWRMWPDGSHATEIVPCQLLARHLVLDGTGMYWTSFHHLMHLAPGGTPESLHDAPGHLFFLTLNDNELFWLEEDGATGRLMKLAR